MRAWNRAKLLWAYLRGHSRLGGLPVEHVVETTAKCNLYCPMCARETYKQPKEDMPEDIFRRLVEESGSSAEHMMLIGLGEPLLDPLIFSGSNTAPGTGSPLCSPRTEPSSTKPRRPGCSTLRSNT